MSNELIRWASPGGGLVPNKQERDLKRASEQLVRDTRLAGLKVDAEAALTARILERVVDIDSYRRQLANSDPTLEAVLSRVELNFVTKAMRIQSRFGEEFPL